MQNQSLVNQFSQVTPQHPAAVNKEEEVNFSQPQSDCDPTIIQWLVGTSIDYILVFFNLASNLE